MRFMSGSREIALHSCRPPDDMGAGDADDPRTVGAAHIAGVLRRI